MRNACARGVLMVCNKPSERGRPRLPSPIRLAKIGPVILSAAKNLGLASEILRCAQNDSESSSMKLDRVLCTGAFRAAIVFTPLCSVGKFLQRIIKKPRLDDTRLLFYRATGSQYN